MGTARRFVRDTLEARRVPGATVDIVELLTSEIVTNAIVHGRSAPKIELLVSDREVRVTVADDCPDRPELQASEAEALRGHGIDLVDRLSAGWGTDSTTGGGKQVWFEVPFRYG